MPSASASASSTLPPLVDPAFPRAYAATRRFRLGLPRSPVVTPDEKAVLFLRAGPRDPKQSLFEMDLATGEAREVASADVLAGGPETLSVEEKARRERMRVTARGLAFFELSEDGRSILTSVSGRLFVIDRATREHRELATGPGAAIDPHFSPDGRRVAYVRDHDVHVVDVDGGRETRVTKGGTAEKTHGLAEFVAQEELRRQRGFWWSPEGASIVYEEADASGVEVLTIADPVHPEREPERFRYPRPGKANADVRLGIVPAKGGATTWIDWDRAAYPYVISVTWAEKAPLTLYVMDRLQKNGVLFAVDPGSGATKKLLEEHDEAWLDVDATVPKWLPGGAGFLWSSDRTGARILELRARDGSVVAPITTKDDGYRALLHVSGKKDAAGLVRIRIECGADPTRAAVVERSLRGDPSAWPKNVLASETKRLGDGDVVEGFTGGRDGVSVVEEASVAALPRVRVLGATQRELPSVAEAPSFVPKVELAEIGDEKIRVAIVRPRSFVPGAKLPVIDAAYGGPHVNVVRADASSYLQDQWLADATSAIVVAIDAKGTPHRGRDWERALAGKLVTVPLEGHVAALRALAARYPEMDGSRIGAFGWSFGGTFAATAALRRPDVYAVAVAGAPVVDWRDYDTAYTERYLGLPAEEHVAYDEASVLGWVKPGAPSAPLLVVHGTADDNVYFFHSLKLAGALERAHVPFDLMPLPGVTHMLHADPELSEAVLLRAAAFLREGLAPTP